MHIDIAHNVTRKRKSHASDVMRNALYISTFSYLLTYMTAHDSQSIGQLFCTVSLLRVTITVVSVAML